MSLRGTLRSIRSAVRRKLRRTRLFPLNRLAPVSRKFGTEYGQPIDRYYIEQFLERHRADIQGRVLEAGDDGYTRRFGGNRVLRSDTLHVEKGCPEATIVGNLETGDGIPKEDFDCLILTQTFQFIDDFESAIVNAHAALRPGGVLLATVSGISQISAYDMERWGEYWRFTHLSARRVFERVFGAANVDVEVYGNVLAASAFLYGLTVQDLTAKELNTRDADYQLVITIRGVRK